MTNSEGYKRFHDALASLAVETVPQALTPITGRLAKLDPVIRGKPVLNALAPVGSAATRARLRELVHTWSAHAPDMGPREIAFALETLNSEHHRRIGKERTEIVWTGPRSTTSPPLRNSEQALKELIDCAENELWMISYVIADANLIGQRLVIAANLGVSVNLLIEPRNEDPDVAYSKLSALGRGVAKQLSVYVWPDEKKARDPNGNGSGMMHAKCALADDKKLLVTSANLTGYAMTLNMELGLMISGGQEPGKLLRHIHGLRSDGYLQAISGPVGGS